MPPEDDFSWRQIGVLIAGAVLIVGLTTVSHWYGFHGNHRAVIASDFARLPQ